MAKRISDTNILQKGYKHHVFLAPTCYYEEAISCIRPPVVVAPQPVSIKKHSTISSHVVPEKSEMIHVYYAVHVHLTVLGLLLSQEMKIGMMRNMYSSYSRPGMNDGNFFHGFICERCVSFFSFYTPASTYGCPQEFVY